MILSAPTASCHVYTTRDFTNAETGTCNEYDPEIVDDQFLSKRKNQLTHADIMFVLTGTSTLAPPLPFPTLILRVMLSVKTSAIVSPPGDSAHPTPMPGHQPLLTLFVAALTQDRYRILCVVSM